MSYIETYFSRVNHMGENVAEIAKNAGVRSFERWLKDSPNTVRQLSVERGLYFDGVILTNKDKEQSKIMLLNVAIDIPVEVGDIMNWDKEKWIIFSKEKKVRETHQTFSIIRCNYLMKWIDSEGHLQQSWSYVVSSMDSKVKENFRTWNSLITPQPNKYLEALIPRRNINRLTRFIIEDEGWYMVEYDHTSVPGIMYISMTEEKINSITDDVKNDIADLDKMAKYEIILPEGSQNFEVGEEVVPIYTVMKNGAPKPVDIDIIPLNKKIIKYVDGKLMAIAEGKTKIRLQLRLLPDIYVEEEIAIGEPKSVIAYIRGSDTIRLDRVSPYEIISTGELNGISFSIDTDTLASIQRVEGNKCFIRANAKNKLGSFVLTAEYDGKIYTKTIKIVPLW